MVQDLCLILPLFLITEWSSQRYSPGFRRDKDPVPRFCDPSPPCLPHKFGIFLAPSKSYTFGWVFYITPFQPQCLFILIGCRQWVQRLSFLFLCRRQPVERIHDWSIGFVGSAVGSGRILRRTSRLLWLQSLWPEFLSLDSLLSCLRPHNLPTPLTPLPNFYPFSQFLVPAEGMDKGLAFFQKKLSLFP